MPETQDQSELIRGFFSHSLEKEEIAFMYLGYAGIILRVKERAVAIDIPHLLGNKEIDAFDKLELLLFTHNHRDHYNRARARRILKTTNAHVVAPAQVTDDLKGIIPSDRLTTASSESPIRAGGFDIVAVEGVHPRPISVYRISKDTFSVFHGGDSGYAPVKDYPAKVAFLPTGRPSPSCSPENALRFAMDLKPSIAVAMHGTPAQFSKFKDLVEKELPDTTVIIPENYKTETITL
jgi:L-ascorbate metabolism protein UlaG (beta-lactamase superfamily)